MIIGVWIFGQFTSSILETSLNDTFNIYRNIDNESMIAKLQCKYELTGEPLKLIKLLVDSVSIEEVTPEINFINKLPPNFALKVLDQVYKK